MNCYNTKKFQRKKRTEARREPKWRSGDIATKRREEQKRVSEGCGYGEMMSEVV